MRGLSHKIEHWRKIYIFFHNYQSSSNLREKFEDIFIHYFNKKMTGKLKNLFFYSSRTCTVSHCLLKVNKLKDIYFEKSCVIHMIQYTYRWHNHPFEFLSFSDELNMSKMYDVDDRSICISLKDRFSLSFLVKNYLTSSGSKINESYYFRHASAAKEMFAPNFHWLRVRKMQALKVHRYLIAYQNQFIFFLLNFDFNSYWILSDR